MGSLQVTTRTRYDPQVFEIGGASRSEKPVENSLITLRSHDLFGTRAASVGIP